MQRKSPILLTLRWVCFAVLLTAVVFRLADRMDWQSVRESVRQSLQTEERKKSFSLENDQNQQNNAETEPGSAEVQATFPTMLYTPPGQVQAVSAELPDVSLVSVRNPTGEDLDLQALMAQPIRFDAEQDEPLILIVHTHATEAYTPSEGEEYEADGAFRTLDTAHNVVRVGQAMADRLNENGIVTLHDTTLNDVPGYNDAYERMAEVIAGYLAQYPSIRMVIDLHRDSIETEGGGELALPVELEGERAVQLLLVMGTDIAGMEHPNWRCNLGFALRLQAYCESLAPGLFREMSLRTQRYNEHLTPYSVLLEVGAAGNTLPEAIRSAEYFADRLAEVIQSAAAEEAPENED